LIDLELIGLELIDLELIDLELIDYNQIAFKLIAFKLIIEWFGGIVFPIDFVIFPRLSQLISYSLKT
jgi:hypothetical protein